MNVTLSHFRMEDTRNARSFAIADIQVVQKILELKKREEECATDGLGDVERVASNLLESERSALRVNLG